MIGRLVEQQQVGLGQQQLGQRDAHLPSAGELVGLARPILLAEAKAGEHAAHLRVERVAIERVEALLQHRIALRGGVVLGSFVVEFGQLAAEALDLAFHLMQLVEDGEAFGEHASAGKAQPLLWQIADTDTARLLHCAVVERLLAGENLHQRGFAGAIGAHKSSFLLARMSQLASRNRTLAPKRLPAFCSEII